MARTGKAGNQGGSGGGGGGPSGIEDEGRSLAFWTMQLQVLRTDDWDQRVRISSGSHDGARVGNVSTVPAIGIKLALRKAMIERAEAEIALAETRAALAELRARRAVSGFLWFALGGGVVGAAAAGLRYLLGL